MKRRILAILLACIMVLSSVPFTVFATEGEAAETIACPGVGKAHLNAQGQTYTKAEAEEIGTEYTKVEATCGNSGYTVYKCNTCGDQFIADVVAGNPNDPHEFGELVAEVKATCTTKGNVEYYFCDKCDTYFAKDKTTVILASAITVNALGHDWTEWTVNEDDCATESRTCKRNCGVAAETRQAGDAKHEHKFVVKEITGVAPTCKDDTLATIVCTECGVTQENVPVDSAVAHVWGEAVKANDPTCTEAGNYAYKQCTVCGKYANLNGSVYADTWTPVIAAYGHYIGTVLSETPSTCLVKGSRTGVCGRCEELVTIELSLAGAQAYYIKKGDVVDTNTLVYKYSGTQYWVCPEGMRVSISSADLKTLAEGESFVKADEDVRIHTNVRTTTYAATCTQYGYDKSVCVLCGTAKELNLVAPLGHEKGDLHRTSVAATCETYGVNVYQCKRCNNYRFDNEIVEPLGHDWKTANFATCTNSGITFTYCANGDKCDGAGVARYEKDTVLTIDGATSKLDKVYYIKVSTLAASAKVATAHSFKNEQVINEPNCTDKGLTISYCEYCGINSTSEPAALGHKFVLTWANGVAHTADKANEFAANKVDATCTAAGFVQITCSNEGCTVKSTANDFAKDGDNLVSLKFKDALGHDEKVAVVDPTCLNGGYSYNYCSRYAACGYNDKDNADNYFAPTTHEFAATYKTYEEAAKYHTIAVGEVLVVGNCDTIGLTKYACSACNKNVLVEIVGTGAHTAPAVADRTEANYKAAKPATCYADGNVENFKCVVCGKWNVADDKIAKDTHNFVLVFDGKAPTCTKTGFVAGYVAVYTCDANDNCNKKIFFVKDGDKYVEVEGATAADVYDAKGAVVADNTGIKTFAAVKLAAPTAHTYGATQVPALAPTCENDGYTAYYLCTKCGYENGKVTLNAYHKNFVANCDQTISANVTCTTAKYVLRVCKYCIEKAEVLFYVPAYGHDWDEGKVTAPTCTAGGYTTYTCKNGCGDTTRAQENKTAQLDHKKGEVAIGNTSGTTPVYYVCGAAAAIKCDTCDFTATAHLPETTNVPATCTTPGYTVTTCSDPLCAEVLEGIKENPLEPALNHKNADGSDCKVVDTEKSYAATESAAGYTYYKCSKCGYDGYEPTITPATSKVYLNLTYANANGKEGYAVSSIVEVQVLLSSKLAELRALNFELAFDTSKLEFISATATKTFGVESINNDGGVIKFAGMSGNALSLDEEDDAIVLATLKFYVKAEGEAKFGFVENASQAYLEAGTALTVVTEAENLSITSVALMDVYTKDNAKAIDMQDALAIYEIMQNKAYNVAADLNKDGYVDAVDLQLFYDYFVGLKTLEEIYAEN